MTDILDIVLIGVWLLVGTVGVAIWVFNLGRHWERLQLQKHRSEDGALHEIVMQQIRTDTICLLACVLVLVMLINLAVIDTSSTRMLIGRVLLTAVVGLLGILGFQQMHDDWQIEDKVRQETGSNL